MQPRIDPHRKWAEIEAWGTMKEVPRMQVTMDEIYLDANATTPVLPEAALAAQEAMQHLFGNPSSSHITGIRARKILESARRLAKALLGIDSGRIVFTSGATEAIQLSVLSALHHAREVQTSQSSLLLYGATEHKAVPQALEHWNRLLNVADEVLAIPVNQYGELDLDFLALHAPRARMVCTMAVNNETGVIHDLVRLEDCLRSRNESALWLVDSVQAVSKVDLNLADLSIDYASVSGHKVFAPKGIGFLYARHGAPITPLIAGGGQEEGARSGTENLPGVAALAAVLERLIDPDDTTFASRESLIRYRDQLRTSLGRAFPDVMFNTPFQLSVPTTINFSVAGFTSKEILDLFDAAGIRVSSGSACGSALRGSYVLDAMGCAKTRSEGAVRISFGRMTTDEEMKAACDRIESAGQALRQSCLIVSDDRAIAADRRRDGMIQLKRGSLCTWIFVDPSTQRTIIVDPCEALLQRIVSLVRCQSLPVAAILATEETDEFVSCRATLLKTLAPYLEDIARSLDTQGWPVGDTVLATDSGELQMLALSATCQVVRVPFSGMTPAGRLYLIASGDGTKLDPGCVRYACTGDSILIGGLGRTDLPNSSALELAGSLKSLQHFIHQDTLICPKHDYTNGFVTTLKAERRVNPLLDDLLNEAIALSQDEFAVRKQAQDARIEEVDGEQPAGLIHRSVESASSVDLQPEELAEFFSRHDGSTIVDVRESHEFEFMQNWDALGIHRVPTNVPLTGLARFVEDLIRCRSVGGNPEFVFVCRSGKRSGQAAEVVRRLGVATSWHIVGGLALGGGRHNDVSLDCAEMEYVI